MIVDLYELIADYTLCNRPNRSEPRVLKRRLKPYPVMTAPRSQMKTSKSSEDKHDECP